MQKIRNFIKKYRLPVRIITDIALAICFVILAFPQEWDVRSNDGGSYGRETISNFSYLYQIKFWHPVDHWEETESVEENGVIYDNAYKIIMGDPYVEIKVLNITVFKKIYSVWQ